MTTKYIAITGSSRWTHEGREMRQGMIVAVKALPINMAKLREYGYADEFDGDPVALGFPRCEPCDAYFEHDNYLIQHNRDMHERPLKALLAEKKNRGQRLGALRERQTDLQREIDAALEAINALDADINALTREPAAAVTT